MFKKAFLPLLTLVLQVSAQQPVWGQCGGNGWSGGTTCVSGAVCTRLNDWYHQCIPGTAPTTTQQPTVLPPTTTIAPPTTTTQPTTGPPTTIPPTTTGPPPAAGTCAAIGTITLRSNARLPDPFTFINGGRVSTKAEYECRRKEISELFQRYELGTLPGPPQSVTASFSGNTLSITVSDQGRSISFTATISNIPSGNGPHPAIIALGAASIPIPSGVATIIFNNDDIAAQQGGNSRGQGKFYTLYGSNHSAGALMAWAWGVSRLIDGLEKATGHRIDTNRLGVTGCSRNGKGAYVIGAFEPRLALTIPQESGSGGAGCWRISDDMKRGGIDTQTASQIIGENVWFSTNFNAHVNSVNNLLHDHHLLAGLVAPRGLYIAENSGINWLGPRSTYGCQTVGRKIYQALGVPTNMGVSQVGTNHCSFPSSQNSELTAFINKFLKGDNSANTNVVRTDSNNLGFTESQYVDWTVPSLA